MSVKIKMLRKTSRGVVGTYENANHHAKECLPLIRTLEAAITQLGGTYDFSWAQGNNVHVIERGDEAKIVLRPFVSEGGEWGIDVHFRTSRRETTPIMDLRYTSEVGNFIVFLEMFLERGVVSNTYGKRPEVMSLKENMDET